jgi:hypothetical protein
MNLKTKWLSLAAAGGALLLAGAAPATAADSVAEQLKGKVVVLKDEKSVAHELKGTPEFYVLYHSASW